MSYRIIHISKKEAEVLHPALKEVEAIIDSKLSKELEKRNYTNAAIYREIKAFLAEKVENLKIT